VLVLQEKILFQTQNILETLLEATDHFSELVKQRNFNQSIFMLSSIVEGYQSVVPHLNELDESFQERAQRIENNFLLLATELEKGNFIKVQEVVQFSLRPGFSSLLKAFVDKIGNQKENKAISIGVFHSWANPKDFTRKERLDALEAEAEKQSTTLYYFSSGDIDFDQSKIEAYTLEDDNWNKVRIPFPDVVHNIGAGKQSYEEKRLRREIPFTSFFVGNKFSLPKRMLDYRSKYVNLLVPFTVCMNEENTWRFIEKHDKFVFKALASNRGENIYFVTKRNDRYILLDAKKESILNERDFQYFLDNIILKEKGSYIIQKYIHIRTKGDEPYHIRAHVHKNELGAWENTLIYATTGHKKTNLSNLSSYRNHYSLSEFLIREYGEKGKKTYYKKIYELALNVAKDLDHLYNYSLSELGLDFAIDEQGQIWMHEANNGPETHFFEDTRAEYVIAYAKYIAENGIMYTDLRSTQERVKGQFDSRSSDLSVVESEGLVRVGLLSLNHDSYEPVRKAFYEESKAKNIQFFYFTPKDIDYNFSLIRGYFFGNGEWTPYMTEFPDVVIDLSKLRGHEHGEIMYRELENLSFLNTIPVHDLSRSTILRDIEDSLQVVDYRVVSRPGDVIDFLDKYTSVIISINQLTIKELAYRVKKIDQKYYLWDNRSITEFTKLELRHRINYFLENNELVVLKDAAYDQANDRSAIFQVHLVKNGQGWKQINANVKIINELDEEMELALHDYLKSPYRSIQKDIDIEARLSDECKNIADIFDSKVSYRISELLLSVAIDSSGSVKLIDLNPVTPNEIKEESLYAKSLLSYAEKIFENNKTSVL